MTYYPLFPKDVNEPPITFKCLHCHAQVRAAISTNANLYSHRDGSRQKGRSATGCPKRSEAIKAGAKLPPTSAELVKQEPSNEKKINEFFFPTEKFDNVVLNHMLTLWLVRNALPWACVEDDALHAAFHYAEPSAQIYMRKWHAQSAQKLYLDLKTSMMTRLKVSFI